MHRPRGQAAWRSAPTSSSTCSAAETGQPPTIVDMMQYGAAMSALQLLRRRRPTSSPGSDIRDGIYGQTHRASRADRRRRRGRRVERAAVPGRQQAGPGAAGRLHGRAQARRRDPAVRQSRWPRCSPRPACPRACCRWCPAVPETGRALTANPELDKFTFTGSSAVGKEIGKLRRREAQAVHAGARRQVRGHHPRGRRPGFDAADAGVLRADELRAGLRRPDPHPGAAFALRRGRREGRPASSPAMPVGLPDDPGADDRPADLREAARARRGLHQEGRRGRRAASSPAAAGPRASTAAGSCSRRCSPTSTTR